MIRISFIIFFIASCSTNDTFEKKVPQNDILEMKKIPVESRLEAKKYIKNQRNYLILLFEQSRDPYYGVPKWKEECLKANKIGEVIEMDKSITFSARLFFGPKGTPGFCLGDTSIVYGQQVIFYCEGSKIIKDIKFRTSEEVAITDNKICD